LATSCNLSAIDFLENALSMRREPDNPQTAHQVEMHTLLFETTALTISLGRVYLDRSLHTEDV